MALQNALNKQEVDLFSDQVITGKKTFAANVTIQSKKDLLLKDGWSRIVNNDGLGNIGWRINAKSTGTAWQSTAPDSWGMDLNFNVESTANPEFKIRASTARSVNAGDPLTMQTLISVSDLAFQYLNNNVWHTGNDSTLMKTNTAQTVTSTKTYTVFQRFQSDIQIQSDVNRALSWRSAAGVTSFYIQRDISNSRINAVSVDPYPFYFIGECPQSAVDPTENEDLTRKGWIDQNVVKLSGDQTIGGIKIFSEMPIHPGNPSLTRPNITISAGGSIPADAANGKIELDGNATMPLISALTKGRVFTIHNLTLSAATLARSGADTFVYGLDESTSLLIPPYSVVVLHGASGKWTILSFIDTNGLPIALGGTGASTIADAKANLEIPFSRVTGAIANTTVTANDNGRVFFANTSSNNVVFTLPNSSGISNTFSVSFIKQSAANSLHIDRSGSDTIGDLTRLTLTGEYASVTLILRGSKWYAISYFSGNALTN